MILNGPELTDILKKRKEKDYVGYLPFYLEKLSLLLLD